MTSTIPSVVLPSGEAIAVLGQGTWHFGEHRARRSDEIASLRLGLELGGLCHRAQTSTRAAAAQA